MKWTSILRASYDYHSKQHRPGVSVTETRCFLWVRNWILKHDIDKTHAANILNWILFRYAFRYGSNMITRKCSLYLLHSVYIVKMITNEIRSEMESMLNWNLNTGIQMCMSESEASGLLHDVKWLEFADVSERLVGHILCFKRMGGPSQAKLRASRRPPVC
jgi:hypothetical protein